MERSEIRDLDRNLSQSQQAVAISDAEESDLFPSTDGFNGLPGQAHCCPV